MIAYRNLKTFHVSKNLFINFLFLDFLYLNLPINFLYLNSLCLSEDEASYFFIYVICKNIKLRNII